MNACVLLWLSSESCWKKSVAYCKKWHNTEKWKENVLAHHIITVNDSQNESCLLGLRWSKYVKYSITDLHFLGNAFTAAVHYDLKTSLKVFFSFFFLCKISPWAVNNKQLNGLERVKWLSAFSIYYTANTTDISEAHYWSNEWAV